MNAYVLKDEDLRAFEEHLFLEEKSAATIEKYLRDARAFFRFAARRDVTKELAVSYKRSLIERGYAVRSINSMLASVKSLKVQRQTYCAEEKELSKAEYLRLLRAAAKKPQLRLILETICGTGIRVSELRFFTVEAVRRGAITVHCKSKIRTILLPGKLRKKLQAYAQERGISSGGIFVTRNGAPLNRSGIWARMKSLCGEARVSPGKVFPHNLRKLFARTFYRTEKDIAKLADILGHSSIDTTRIYIMTTGTEHRRKLDCLGLVV